MKNYVKPIALLNEEIMEGVYAASGSGCYSVRTNIHQKPETGRGDYRIQVNATHKADHTCSEQILTLMFNQEVTYVSSNGSLAGAGTSNVIKIKYSYWNNPTDDIGLGDVVVTSEPGLVVTGAMMTDNG